MKVLLRISEGTDRLNEIIGRGVSWLTTLMVLVFVYDVIMRYAFNKTSVAVFEVEWHLFALIFLVGAGYALKHDRHVRVDLFYANFSSKGKALVNMVGTLLFLFPFCLICIRYSFDFAKTSFEVGESSADPGGLPWRFIIKSAIPLGLSLLLLQGFSVLLKSIMTLGNFRDFFSEENTSESNVQDSSQTT